MIRNLIGILVLVVAYVGFRELYTRLASDEQQILWLIEDAQAGFDGADVGDCAAVFAEDWVHDGGSRGARRVDREDLIGGLQHLFIRERGGLVGEFPMRVRVPEDRVRITFPRNEDHGEVVLELVFERRRGEAWELAWRVAFDARCEERAGRWKITRSSHEALEGRGL